MLIRKGEDLFGHSTSNVNALAFAGSHSENRGFFSYSFRPTHDKLQSGGSVPSRFRRSYTQETSGVQPQTKPNKSTYKVKFLIYKPMQAENTTQWLLFTETTTAITMPCLLLQRISSEVSISMTHSLTKSSKTHTHTHHHGHPQ
jgi:hypothetical protein